MRNKGIVIVTAVLLTLTCLFYLSFPIATNYYDNQAAKIKDPIDQQNYKDSVKYLGIYDYQKCLQTQIGLGLDLKGGMNVVLEISVPDVVDMLADHKTEPAFVKSMNEARQQLEAGKSDFISLFIDAYHKNAPGHNLAEVFATQQLQGKVSPTSSDSEVEKVLRSEVSSAIDNSFNVVRTRIDQFGVVQPNIQRIQGAEGRIMVEMPGIKEPERMRKLLQGSANLEFWETYNAEEIIPYLQQLDQRLASGEQETASKKDTAAAEQKAKEAAPAKKQAAPKFKLNNGKKADNIKATPESELEQAKKQHPLLAFLQTTGSGSLSLVGYASARDTAAINKAIYGQVAKQVLPTDLRLMWSAKPTDNIQAKNIYELHALKVTTTNGRAPLEGDVITDASDQFNHVSGAPEVSMSMNSEGARRWSELTKANIGKAIAIVLDGVVYTSPRILSQIDGGQSSITGNFTIEDTKDLANTLKSGRMPAPAHIVQEEVVGPTLGAQSIQQGIISFAIAFVLLIVYMLVVYNIIPGSLAVFALLLNVFFTLGILTSFQAALTMSGIAGMVLSLGTAVDANVLIYERIKEELRSGKDMRLAINAGYSNAFSAIFDSNLTSIITGVILYLFGTGPIRGFATTWIIGIVCSFFTAVYITRLVYDYKINHGKWMHLKLWTGVSKNLMQGTNFKFMSAYKKSFTFAGIALVVFIVSFATRHLAQSIDFTGGRNYVVQFEKATEPEQVRVVLEKTFPGYTTSAISLGNDGRTVRISTNYKIESTNPKVDGQVETMLFKGLKDANLVSQKDVETFKNPDIRQGGSIISSSKVGPSIAKDVTRSAIISVVIALVAIFLYILLRFRNVAFSLGSTIALTFDALTVIGLFSLLQGLLPFSLEVDQTFIGAVLTVIGYSINDKVVVFDRIRENLQLHPKENLQKLFNDSINQTLARTINTSVTTLVVLLCILFLGGKSIQPFAFAMTLGVVFGTLSSIFLASPIAYIVMGHSIKEQANTEVAKA
ncbi:MAG: protein translocase subunit SecDF [Prevotella sp.]|uniref:protein translocase subunit SecDF n=1 Tax=Hallella TaxID=52228 RepID=UPI002590A899|nr:protein translocase subunit SecDF [Hallella sp.]MCI7434962.1 protein translocase subunit SecDF [Prevotella sp.]MDD7144682.1 protein translocase subunit SecDF [Hallella sp.]MDY5924740.1 protein translocase subunit SecDF [Hallella sp.]